MIGRRLAWLAPLALAGCGGSSVIDSTPAPADFAMGAPADTAAPADFATPDLAVPMAPGLDLATPDLAPPLDATPPPDLSVLTCVQLGCDGGLCDVDAGVCRSCMSDRDCGDPALPRCDPMAHYCVPCLPQNDNCAPGSFCTAVNNPSNWMCARGCKLDGDCRGDGGVSAGICCNHLCTDGAKDNGNCGGCGVACAMGQSCCGGACDDLGGDVANCGSCANACKLANAAPACKVGKCGVGKCNAGFGDCNLKPDDGCEVNLNTDTMNCLACGKVCMVDNGVAGCKKGCVVASCNPGSGDCNMDPSDGCETNVYIDPQNCGTCGNACITPNATPECKSGLCVAGCNPNFADCNMDPKDGCEVDLNNDPKNCGACAGACKPGQVCGLGKCHNPCDVLFQVQGGSNAAPAIGGDGTIYAIGIDGFVRAFQPFTGQVLWVSDTSIGAGHSNYYAIGGLATDGTALYAGGPDGNLYSFSLKGKLQWKVQVGGDLTYATPAIGGQALGGAIVAAGNGTQVVALNPNGAVKWTYTLGGAAWSSSPALASDGTTYIATWNDQSLYAIKADGSLKWKASNGGGAVTSPSIGQDGTIYVGNHGPSDGLFRAFNPNGTVKWMTQVGNFHGGSAISSGGVIYAGNDYTLVALKSDGSVKWASATGPSGEPWVCGSNMIGDDGNIYVPVCGNQTVAVLEPTQGNLICQVPVNGYPGPMTLDSNGIMYVGATGGLLYAYVGTSHRLDGSSPWPKHHRDVANTGQLP